MKRISLKIISALLAAFLCMLSAACTGTANEFSTEDIEWRDGEICASPHKAYYGKDNESDKTFTVIVAVTNKTQYAKKLTQVNIKSIKDKKERPIIKAAYFTLDEDTYLGKDEKHLVECVFENDQILLDTSLEQLSSEIEVLYEGCVKNGPEPPKSDSGYTMSVIEALFTSTDAVKGTIAIRNNFAENRTPEKIVFSLYTQIGDKNKKVYLSKRRIVIENDIEIEAGAVVKLNIAIPAQDVNAEIASKKAFGTFDIEIFSIK